MYARIALPFVCAVTFRECLLRAQTNRLVSMRHGTEWSTRVATAPWAQKTPRGEGSTVVI